MPLAIELAAAWTRTLSCAELAAELAEGVALLATDLRGVPERHRSIEAVLAQAWAGLPPELQLALARLSLVPAGCTRELAAAVAAASPPVLAQLTERALLSRAADGRYQLHPLVRQYARQRLRELPAEERVTAAEGAVPLLAHALIHPASRTETTARAQPLLARCEERLTAAAFAAAVARGRETPLGTLVADVLDSPAAWAAP